MANGLKRLAAQSRANGLAANGLKRAQRLANGLLVSPLFIGVVDKIKDLF